MTRFRVEILPEAEAEFREAFLWYFERSPNLSARHIAIVCLLSTSWPRNRRVTGSVVDAIAASSPGSYKEVEIP